MRAGGGGWGVVCEEGKGGGGVVVWCWGGRKSGVEDVNGETQLEG